MGRSGFEGLGGVGDKFAAALCYGRRKGVAMSAAAKVKTYAARADGVYPLTFEISQPADLRVYLSDCDGDVELTRGVDYSLSGVEKGAQSVTVSKAHDGAVTLACVPCVDFELQKFGVSMLPDLNEWAVRLAQRVAYLEARLDRAASVPLGGACKDDCALPVLDGGKVVWVSAADLADHCGLTVIPVPAVLPVALPPAVVKVSKFGPFVPDINACHAPICVDLPIVRVSAEIDISLYEKPCPILPSIHYLPSVLCVCDYCKPLRPWQDGEVVLVQKVEKPQSEFRL